MIYVKGEFGSMIDIIRKDDEMTTGLINEFY